MRVRCAFQFVDFHPRVLARDKNSAQLRRQKLSVVQSECCPDMLICSHSKPAKKSPSVLYPNLKPSQLEQPPALVREAPTASMSTYRSPPRLSMPHHSPIPHLSLLPSRNNLGLRLSISSTLSEAFSAWEARLGCLAVAVSLTFVCKLSSATCSHGAWGL